MREISNNLLSPFSAALSVYEKLKAKCKIFLPAGRLQMVVPSLHTASFPHDNHVVDADDDDNDTYEYTCPSYILLVFAMLKMFNQFPISRLLDYFF